MGYLSITQVSVRYNTPRKTVASAVFRKYLKSFQNQKKQHFILDDDAEFYFKGPPFPYWWSFQQISKLGIPIHILYQLRDSSEFRSIKWKKNIYAYIPGVKGIEATLKALGFLARMKPMMKMERPIIDS